MRGEGENTALPLSFSQHIATSACHLCLPMQICICCNKFKTSWTTSAEFGKGLEALWKFHIIYGSSQLNRRHPISVPTEDKDT